MAVNRSRSGRYGVALAFINIIGSCFDYTGPDSCLSARILPRWDKSVFLSLLSLLTNYFGCGLPLRPAPAWRLQEVSVVIPLPRRDTSAE